MNPTDIDWERLDRYVSGRGTPEELAALRRWVESDPELSAAAAVMSAAGLPPGAPAHTWDSRALWQQLHRQMRRGDRPPLRIAGSGQYSTGGWRRRRGWQGVAAAAAVVLVTLGGLALWRMTPGVRHVAPAAGPMREMATRRGERAALDLPDGSHVVLAAASRLRIPPGYAPSAGARDVFLEGEAYFEVTHDSTRPFRVHAANGVAEDLGTQFVVTAYPETHGVRVAVAAGAVALRTADTLRAQPRASLTLARGELGRLDSAGIATLTRGIDLNQYLGWVRGSLVFNAAPLRDVIPTLSRWYDLDIHLADSTLAERRLTATVRSQSAAEALELLALSLDLVVERNGKTVTLARKIAQ